MLRVLPLGLTLVLLLMAAPVFAIPICPSGTMADYLGFGTAGCQFNSLTFSNFDYSNLGGVRHGFEGVILFPPPSGISVQPRSDPANLGSGGAALRIKPFPLLPGLFWEDLSIDFNVAGPGIVGNRLFGSLQNFANLESAFLSNTTTPGGVLGLVASFSLCEADPNPPSACTDTSGKFVSSSFARTELQVVSIRGDNVLELETGFATPEPATLVLVGTGAAGVGLARWLKKRRCRGDDRAA